MRTKVLLYSCEFPPKKDSGGIGNHAYHLANQLSLNNYEVHVLSETRDRITSNFEVGFELKYIYKSNSHVVNLLKRLFFVFIAANKVEIVFCSGQFQLWFAPILKLFQPRAKYFAITHGSELDPKNVFLKRLTRYSLSRFDKIIAVSNYTAKFIPKEFINKLTIIPNGIDFNNIPKTNLRLGNQLKLLTVGSTSKRKGQINVVKSIPLIIKKFPLLRYYMIGSIGYKNEILLEAQKLNVEKNCILLGKLSDAELYKYYSSVDIFCMLSEHTVTGDFEGFGIAILEANFFGIPAIGSKGSGIEDAISDGFNGILVDPHNVNDVKDAIITIMENYAEFERNSLNWAKKHNWKIIFDRYLDIINEIFHKQINIK